ncbi:MAG: (2Fe-2S)-binding protein [Clostridia bacterium]|nr:(2Fe-2S)-binding protein [Clostridia bacterium]
MRENFTVCHCKKVTLGDIEDALHAHDHFDSVLAAFEDVKNVTGCSTGCGGCYDSVLDVISELMMAPPTTRGE